MTWYELAAKWLKQRMQDTQQRVVKPKQKDMFESMKGME